MTRQNELDSALASIVGQEGLEVARAAIKRIRYPLFNGSDQYRKNEDRLRTTPEKPERCARCGRPTSRDESTLWVHYLTSGEITSDWSEATEVESQGVFVIGPECAKRLPKGFARKIGDWK